MKNIGLSNVKYQRIHDIILEKGVIDQSWKMRPFLKEELHEIVKILFEREV